jgi:hypothetical protein
MNNIYTIDDMYNMDNTYTINTIDRLIILIILINC